MSETKNLHNTGLTTVGRDEDRAFLKSYPEEAVPIDLAQAIIRKQQAEYQQLLDTHKVTNFEALPSVEEYLKVIRKIPFGITTLAATDRTLSVLANEHLRRLGMSTLPIGVFEINFKDYGVIYLNPSYPWRKARFEETEKIFDGGKILLSEEYVQLQQKTCKRVEEAIRINHSRTDLFFNPSILELFKNAAFAGAAWIHHKEKGNHPLSPSAFPMLNMLELGVIPYGPSRDGQSFEVLSTPAPHPLSSA